MREQYIFEVDAKEVMRTIFWAYVNDHNIDLKNDNREFDYAKIRCAVTACAVDFQRYLIDYFDIDDPEEVELD